jgi:hypothetical protein
MIKKRTIQKSTLLYGAYMFIVYLRTLHLPYTQYAMYLRVLSHILRFYGPDYLLKKFDGKIMLQYADVYDPYSRILTIKERGTVFWKFMFFLKRNAMIPDWTDPVKAGD